MDQNQTARSSSSEANPQTVVISDEPSLLITCLNALTGLSLLGGVALAYAFWPDSAYTVPADYTGSVVWFIAGVIQSALFGACSAGLDYLKRITAVLEAKSRTD